MTNNQQGENEPGISIEGILYDAEDKQLTVQEALKKILGYFAAAEERGRQITTSKVNRVEPTPKDIERFWSKVEKTDSCWLYKGGLSNGYGQFYYGGKNNAKYNLAHRFSYELSFGKLPPKNSNLTLDHQCRVRNCVNPIHLELVSVKENYLEVLDTLHKISESKNV